MRQGLSRAEDGILLIKIKPKQITKTTPWGKNSAGNLMHCIANFYADTPVRTGEFYHP